VGEAEHTTAGSTKAVTSLPSSNSANPKETAAETNKMMTNWSLNCSSTSFHNGVGGSSGRAVAQWH